MRLRELPLKLFRAVYRDVRKTLFTKPRPRGAYLVVPHDVSYVERLLGQHSYAQNWVLSYNYRDEDLNLARVRYDMIEGTDVQWWQTHVRGWERDGAVWLKAHYEPEPVKNPKAHLRGVANDVDADERVARVLEESQVSFERRLWDG